MIGLYVGVGVVLILIAALGVIQRRQAVLAAENQKLKDQLLEKVEDGKIEALQEKLSSDAASGAKDEANYLAWRAANPSKPDER